MMIYEKARQELKNRGENVRYFSREFFREYEKARAAVARQIEKDGQPEREETQDGVQILTAYKKIFDTDFYKKSGGAYCLFLEIANAERGRGA